MKDCIYISRFYNGVKFENSNMDKDEYCLLVYIQQFFHEIGHCIYQSNINDKYAWKIEETFCDKFSAELVMKLYGIKIYNSIKLSQEKICIIDKTDWGYIGFSDYNPITIENFFNENKIPYNQYQIKNIECDLFEFKSIVNSSLELLKNMDVKTGVFKVYLCDGCKCNYSMVSNKLICKKKPYIVTKTDKDNLDQNIKNLELIYEEDK